MRKAVIVYSCVLSLLLSGCTAKQKAGYTLQQTDFVKIERMIESRESFIVIASIPLCEFCDTFKFKLTQFVEAYEYPVYELSIEDDERFNLYQEFIIENPYDDQDQEISFPSTIIYKKGKFTANSKGIINEKTFKEWVSIKMK